MAEVGPVLVFDSGIGGLSVVRAIRALLADIRARYEATEDPRYQERGNSLPGRALRQRSSEEAAALASQISTLADPIVRELGLHHEQQ